MLEQDVDYIGRGDGKFQDIGAIEDALAFNLKEEVVTGKSIFGLL